MKIIRTKKKLKEMLNLKMDEVEPLSGYHFIGVSLNDFNASKSWFYDCIFERCKFYDSSFNDTKFSKCRFIGAEFMCSELEYDYFIDCSFSWSIFSNCNFFGSNFRLCKFSSGKFLFSDFSNTIINNCWISNVNFSGCKGFLNPKKWMKKNFSKIDQGFIVYKAFFETIFDPPANWMVESGKYIEEIVNSDRSIECGCGVNFGTLDYIRFHFGGTKSHIWKCLIEWEDLINVVVPYNTDGKARCSRLKLIERIE